MELPRVYPILDSATLVRRGCPVERFAEAVLEAGAAILQFRHKGHFSRELFESARRVRMMCGNALLVVNDRADIAMLLECGLHVGQDDLPPAHARALLGPSAFIGHSTHSASQLRDADQEPVSYVAIGPVFTTASKENPDPALGAASLVALRRLTAKPLAAIGGITRENALEVYAAGIDSIAVIGDLLPPELDRRSIRQRMEEWLNLSKA
jgi:thiamine-phosphate pyrophosphorylase